VGLPELVTETEKDYEALILELATNPKKLAKIKEKLATNRLTQPLLILNFTQSIWKMVTNKPTKTILRVTCLRQS
jgi:predicted O-linked N-acetylglucosamine transferase (SPINDLY family)